MEVRVARRQHVIQVIQHGAPRENLLSSPGCGGPETPRGGAFHPVAALTRAAALQSPLLTKASVGTGSH